MTIDIISYTPAQYAALTEEQVLQIKSAQLKKNRLHAVFVDDLQREKQKLVQNGIFLSTIWTVIKAKLQSNYEQEVQNIRDGLLFYLRYTSRPNDSDSESAPYEVNYALSEEARLNIVKTYYENTYQDANKLFEEFKKDTVAVQYLGELYSPLYDYFLAKTDG